MCNIIKEKQEWRLEVCKLGNCGADVARFSAFIFTVAGAAVTAPAALESVGSVKMSACWAHTSMSSTWPIWHACFVVECFWMPM
jgi:hypothetical protein